MVVMTGEAIVGLVAILVTVLFQALYVSYKMGKFEEKLAEIDKKQDKHNNLIERMVAVEQSGKSAHIRLNTIEDYLYRNN
jgi:hypothetical protein